MSATNSSSWGGDGGGATKPRQQEDDPAVAAARRNFMASTALTALLGWSVHRPNLVLFMIGWTVSLRLCCVAISPCSNITN